MDDKTWIRLQRQTDTRITVQKEESSPLINIKIEGPSKSSIENCLMSLEELVLGESEVKPSKRGMGLHQTLAKYGHSGLSLKAIKDSLDDEAEMFRYECMDSLQHRPSKGTSLQSKLGASTHASRKENVQPESVMKTRLESQEQTDDVFLDELQEKMEKLNLEGERENAKPKEQTSPFGKYGIMATVTKQRAKSDDVLEKRSLSSLEEIARRSMHQGTPDKSDSATPERERGLAKRASQPSLHYSPSVEDSTSWRTSLVAYSNSDDCSSSTSTNSVVSKQDHQKGSVVRYTRDELLEMAQSSASLHSPDNFINWTVLQKIYPHICLEKPWGFEPLQHHVPDFRPSRTRSDSSIDSLRSSFSRSLSVPSLDYQHEDDAS